MKLKIIKQQLMRLVEQHENNEPLDLEKVSSLKTALQEKKNTCKYKLRHRVNFVKRARTEKKLKQVKSCLKQLKPLLDTMKSE